MILKQVFTALNGLPLQILVVTPSIHLEWSILGNLLGFIGYLLLDLVMLVSYHLLAIGRLVKEVHFYY